MSPEQRRLARHALGLPNNMNRSYRNRFYTAAGHHPWREMERAGLAEGSDVGDDGMRWFSLTRKGAAIALDAGETLDREDFPPLPAAPKKEPDHG